MIGLQNPHLQTLGAYVIRGKMSDYRAVRHVVTLRDGDRIVVHDDQPKSWITGDRIAILIHGLCGCHSSPYVRRASDKLRRHGIRTFRLDMRGFGVSTLISRAHIHAGLSSDLNDVLEFVTNLSPLSKISLIGFSLGGNIVLKALGEWGFDYPREVDSAVAVSAPVNLAYCSMNLRQNGNRIYDRYFMRLLKSQLAYRRRHVEGLVDNGLNPLPDRLLEFDDRFVAPVHGFRDARDYYEQCSSGPVLHRIEVPTIILAAQDDPIVPFASYDTFSMSRVIERVSTRYGGHLGFLSRGLRDPDRHWMDWRISQWISSLDQVV